MIPRTPVTWTGADGVVSQEGEILVSGERTQVMLDYDSGDTIPTPNEVRAAVEAWEPKVSDAPRRPGETFGGV